MNDVPEIIDDRVSGISSGYLDSRRFYLLPNWCGVCPSSGAHKKLEER